MEFDCDNIKEFFHVFFQNRKCMGLDDKLTYRIDPEKVIQIQLDRFNRFHLNKKIGFYGMGSSEEGKLGLVLGWTGGGMYTYALMKLGGSLEWERSLKTLAQLFRGQGESGLFYSCCNSEGIYEKSGWNAEARENCIMTRRSGDVLYYLIKHFRLMEERAVPVPENWKQQTRKLADAFVRMWQKYHQFGQFADCRTGEILVGGSTSGGIIPGGLAEAAVYFHEPEYMQTAKESAEYYYKQVLEYGCTTGGPGEALQVPDSESGFALVQSFASLYQCSGEEQWLDYGRFALEYWSSWVVAYNYRFPESSEFYRLDMKSTGCVFANLQNKHAAPTICTASPYCVYQFYQWTGEKRYLELFCELTDTISQYMSTDDRPIYSWTVPKDPTLLKPEERVYQDSKALGPGYICERVNLSDWETEACIGGVFHESCVWCEAALLLTMAECQDARATAVL